MDDADDINAPLAALHGVEPPAPPWFMRALADAPERRSIEVAGARIETLAWGEVGDPGLLLLVGSGAHADWYSFIAPLLKSGRRVATLSWSGMGGSDWRARYSRETFMAEALAVAEATGLFAGRQKPVVVGHSFGGRIAIALAAQDEPRFSAAIVVDPPVFSPESLAERAAAPGPPTMRERAFRPHRVYPSLEAALARFRFAPVQPCANLYIADFIARRSLKQALDADGAPGWTWRFDPFLWRDLQIGDPDPLIAAARCPMALIRGARSTLMRPGDARHLMTLLPAGSPFVEIAEAQHHVMVDQPIAFVEALQRLLAEWPWSRPG
jgi:pimeloyl-ACP methyl ester carboxylesterase